MSTDLTTAMAPSNGTPISTVTANQLDPRLLRLIPTFFSSRAHIVYRLDLRDPDPRAPGEDRKTELRVVLAGLDAMLAGFTPGTPEDAHVKLCRMYGASYTEALVSRKARLDARLKEADHLREVEERAHTDDSTIRMIFRWGVQLLVWGTFFAAVSRIVIEEYGVTQAKSSPWIMAAISGFGSVLLGIAGLMAYFKKSREQIADEYSERIRAIRSEEAKAQYAIVDDTLKLLSTTWKETTGTDPPDLVQQASLLERERERMQDEARTFERESFLSKMKGMFRGSKKSLKPAK